MIWEIDERARTIEGLDERGRPRAEYAASLGLVAAPVGRRIVATAIEAAVLLLLQLPMALVALPVLIAASSSGDPAAELGGRDDLVLVIVCAAISYALTTAFAIVQLILLGRRGVTLGKAATGLRAVNVRTLARPGFWRGAVVRYLVLIASLLLPVVGPLVVIALSPLFDPGRRGRGWPDLAAAIWLVDVRRGLHPYDDKRMRIARKTVATDLRDDRPELPSLATPGAATASGAYVPLARNKGGVLGAVRSAPHAGAVAGFGETAAAADADTDAEAAPARIPTVAVSTPIVVHDELAPPRAADAAAMWSPPSLLGDPAAPAPELVVELTLDSGETVSVTGGGVVLGRAPSTRPDDVEVSPLPIADPTRSISKTHWALIRQGERVVAVERGSTNGSMLVRAGTERALEPEHPVELHDGDTVRFGDRHAVIAIR